MPFNGSGTTPLGQQSHAHESTDIVHLVDRSVPQSAREAAIQAAIHYYAPPAGDSRTHAERRELALASQLAVYEAAGPAMQESVMRALMVQQLLDEGYIDRLPPDPCPPPALAPIADVSAEARQIYVAAVAADARLASRLINKTANTFPALPGESMQDHFSRVAGADFDAGFMECEYPTLHEQALSAARESAAPLEDRDFDDSGFDGHDEQDLVDENRIRRENMHLIKQALSIRMDSEARALGIQSPTPVADSIDIAALVLGDVDFDAGNNDQGAADSRSDYPRDR